VVIAAIAAATVGVIRRMGVPETPNAAALPETSAPAPDLRPQLSPAE
jgi:hypothetical protein